MRDGGTAADAAIATAAMALTVVEPTANGIGAAMPLPSVGMTAPTSARAQCIGTITGPIVDVANDFADTTGIPRPLGGMPSQSLAAVSALGLLLWSDTQGTLPFASTSGPSSDRSLARRWLSGIASMPPSRMETRRHSATATPAQAMASTPLHTQWPQPLRLASVGHDSPDHARGGSTRSHRRESEWKAAFYHRRISASASLKPTARRFITPHSRLERPR